MCLALRIHVISTLPPPGLGRSRGCPPRPTRGRSKRRGDGRDAQDRMRRAVSAHDQLQLGASCPIADGLLPAQAALPLPDNCTGWLDRRRPEETSLASLTPTRYYQQLQRPPSRRARQSHSQQRVLPAARRASLSSHTPGIRRRNAGALALGGAATCTLHQYLTTTGVPKCGEAIWAAPPTTGSIPRTT
jgi:hypothetical protein